MAARMSAALATNLNPFGVAVLLGIAGACYWLFRRKQRELWPLVGLGTLLLFNFLFSKNFFALTVRDGALYGTPINLLNQGSVVMLLAIGMTLVIAVKGIDLSVGSVMAFSGAVCVVLMSSFGWTFATAALTALVVSLGFGLLNGALVTWLNVQPIIATLITMVAGRGVAMLVTDAQPVTFENDVFQYVGTGHFWGLPVSFLLVMAVFAATVALTRKTALGLFMEVVGDNEEAARLAGVPSQRIKLWIYGVSGLCAGIAGIIAASYISTADPDRVGRLRELDAIFAVVIGGTALTGGRFYLLGTLLGAVLIQTLSITMYNQQVPSEIEPMPKAVVILLVCLLLSPQSRKRVVELFHRLLHKKPLKPSSVS